MFYNLLQFIFIIYNKEKYTIKGVKYKYFIDI